VNPLDPASVLQVSTRQRLRVYEARWAGGANEGYVEKRMSST